jgi:hypothetical protein
MNNQRAEYARHHGQDIEFSDVEVGDDSASGKAVRVKFGDDWKWVPYSQVKKITRDQKTVGQDKITVTQWWAEKEELA